MKQTDIYTEALVCLRLILQTDHPEFKNWLDWLGRDIEDWTQRREVAHHLLAYGGMVLSTICPICGETMIISSIFSNRCATPLATAMASGKEFHQRH